jgi:hypothetical protein
MAGPITGRANTYPRGQCTWWAAERYYELHAIFPPAWGNAASWQAGAMRDGWTVSASPIENSIICLQPGIQGANPVFGHVGVVETVLDSTHVDASNQNWGGVEYPNFSHVTFQTGPGVSFISAVGGSSVPYDPCLQFGPPGSDPYIHCQGQLASNRPPSAGGSSWNDIFSFFQSLGAWVNDPTRMLKAILGVALIIAGLALIVKIAVPPEAVTAIAGA